MGSEDVIGLVLGAGLVALGAAAAWASVERAAETAVRGVFASVWAVLLGLMVLLVGRYADASVRPWALHDLVLWGMASTIPAAVVWLVYFLPPQPPWPAKRRRAVAQAQQAQGPAQQAQGPQWPQQKEQPFHTGEAPPWIEEMIEPEPPAEKPAERPARGGMVTPESRAPFDPQQPKQGGSW